MGHAERTAAPGAAEVTQRPRRVRLSREARADLSGIRQWQLQPGSGSAAKRRVQRILGAVRRLADHPYIGATGEFAGTRRLMVDGHAVIYRVRPDTGREATAGDVLVLRVFGPGQSRADL